MPANKLYNQPLVISYQLSLCKFTQLHTVEQNDSERPIRPLFSTPGMKLWLLIALHFGCYGILTLLTRIEVFSWLQVDQETSTPMISKLVNGIISVLLFLVPAIIFASAVMPERFDYYKLYRKVNVLPASIAALGIISSVFFIEVIYQWNVGLFTDPAMLDYYKARLEYSNWHNQMPGVFDLLVYLLSSALAPAVVEELFFRGGIQQLIMGWIKKPHVAIVISALIFSFLHFDTFAFVPRLILGIALGYLFWWSGSLRLSIIAHFIFNAFEIISEYCNQHWPRSWWAKLEVTYVMGVISLVVAVGAMLTVKNLLRRQTTPS
jgi:membrane protease YdiL (CAAX protease family)